MKIFGRPMRTLPGEAVTVPGRVLRPVGRFGDYVRFALVQVTAGLFLGRTDNAEIADGREAETETVGSGVYFGSEPACQCGRVALRRRGSTVNFFPERNAAADCRFVVSNAVAKEK